MAASDLTTIAAVKAWLVQDQTVTFDDALVTRLITAASGFITAWLDTSIKSATYTEYRNGNNQGVLVLKHGPVTAVSSVVISGVALAGVPNVSLGTFAPGYVFDAEAVYLRNGVFSKGVQNVAITYTAGYAVVPPEIEQACIELVVLRYRERGREGQASKNIGNGQVVAFSVKDMHPATATLLRQYKRVTGIW